jgi:hypothetical protein
MQSQNEKGGLIAALIISFDIFRQLRRAARRHTEPTTQSYLPEAAPAAWGYIAAIISSRALMLLPVSRVASTAG